MAIGEAACVSVHGANRLGTNSLLDIIVFGRACALRAQETLKPGAAQKKPPQSSEDKALARFDRIRNAKGRLKSGQIRDSMQHTMQDHCAVFRDAKTLKQGVAKMADVAASMREMSIADRSLIWNSDLVEALELDNLVSQSVVVLDSAVNRTESRGAHAREDFPKRDDKNWMKHTVSWLDEKGKTRLGYRPVHNFTLSNDVQPFPPKERVY